MVRLTSAVEGFDLACRARGLSPHTIADYTRTLTKFMAFLADDPPVASIARSDVEKFLAAQDVSRKSVLNYYIGLSAFWTWCLREAVCEVHIIRGIRPPRPEQRVIQPLSEDELRRVLGACDRSRAYRPAGAYRSTTNALPNGLRSRAIILLLLDTGVRASELVQLRIRDLNLKAGTILVMGKGGKERRIPFGARTGKAIWKYLSSLSQPQKDDYVFQTTTGGGLTRNGLAHRLQQIGDRAGVDNVHPHRLRHTFAINYLRNGGDVYTLQAILGHHTLEMCRRYLALAQVDLEAAHRRASPVENWSL